MPDKIMILALLIALALISVGGGALMLGDVVRMFILNEPIPVWRVAVIIAMMAIGLMSLVFVPDAAGATVTHHDSQ